MRPNRVPYAGKFVRGVRGLGALTPPCYAEDGSVVDCGDPSAVTDSAGNLTSHFTQQQTQLAVPIVQSTQTPGSALLPTPDPGGPAWTENSSPSSISVDPTILLAGVGLLAFASFFLGGRVEPQRKLRGRTAARLERQIAERKRKLKELQS